MSPQTAAPSPALLTLERKEDESCPIVKTIHIISGKWKFSIIYSLMKGTKRFKELERDIPGINTKMLTKELKDLEKHQIVNRKAYPTIPPTVEYSLTKKGQEFEPILLALQEWGLKHI